MNLSFWKNKNVLVTGGSSGIGKSILEVLSNTEANLINLSRRQIDKNITSIACDFSDRESINKAFLTIREKYETIDVLINNAGITVHSRFDEIEIETIQKSFQINCFGPVELTLKLFPLLKKSKNPIITITSTVSGLYGIPARGIYSATKSSLHSIFEALRIETLNENLKIMIFCPPYTKTNLRTSGFNGRGEIIKESFAKLKNKTPKEVAEKMIEKIERQKSKLFLMDKTGFFVKWMRNIAPNLLEKILYKKLSDDFKSRT